MAPTVDIQALLDEVKRLRDRLRRLENGAAFDFSSALLRLSSAAPIGLVIVDAQLRYLYINDYLARLHGRAAAESLGRPLREVVGASADELEPLYRRVLETGETFTAEVTLPAPPGSIGQYVSTYYPLRDDSGNITGVCGAIRDVTAARTAEAKLRSSEQRYRNLAESLSEIVWTENANGEVDYINPHGLKYAGLREAREWSGAIHPEDLPRLRACASGETEIELRIRRAAEGEYRWHLARIARPPDESGRMRLLGTAIDIHDRKRAELTKELLASIVESSSDAIVGLDLEGRITGWNRAAERLFGYSPTQAIGRPASILQSSETEAGIDEMLPRVAAGETVESQETIRATADGRELSVFISWSPIRDEAGRVTGAFKTIRDVTDQRRVERELRSADERFRMAQKALGAGIWERDLVAGTSHWSPELFELLGIEPMPAPHMGLLLERVHPDDAERVRRDVSRAIERQQELRHQFRITRHGQARWITTFARVVADPGRPPRLIGISIDTTDLHAAEDAVRQAARFESIARLAGGVAHDFNNLLAGIMGGASFISEVLPEDHSAHSMLDLIVRSSERAAQLTRQLLAYAGQGAFTMRRIDLSRAVQEACSLVRGSLSSRVEFEVQTGWDLPPIEADPNQIREVVLNLVVNASEAIGETVGSVRVRTGIERLDRAAISARFSGTDAAPGAYVYLEVRDSGPGMTPDVVNRIFEPFFTTRFMGRGLGLSAVQGIVRGHRGAIDLETSPGSGARFRVYFPAAAAEAARPPAPRIVEERGRSVLVIDDEEAVRNIVRAVLSRAGYSVLTAADGLAGLELFRSRQALISLVILDVSMPKMSGAEVLAEIRNAGSRVKILITSGYPESEAMAHISQEDIAGFLQKPFTVRQVAALISRVLGETTIAGSN
ncbi:MAG TPA: PAS domain S-box protein [Bryobacteraceae bacterium]|nr:PAS domain S-box protein [Bryobacteraceae bacterium]